jgi:hypothetical protein
LFYFQDKYLEDDDPEFVDTDKSGGSNDVDDNEQQQEEVDVVVVYGETQCID